MTVLKHTSGNIGGINPVQYIFWEDVAAYTVDLTTLAGSITLKSDKRWKYLYATPETIQLEVKEEDTPAGIKYTCQLKMLIPKDRAEVEIALHDLNNRNLIFKVLDKNGVCRFFGSMDAPMKKLGKLLKPNSAEGFNGWEVVFTAEFSAPAAYGESSGTPFIP